MIFRKIGAIIVWLFNELITKLSFIADSFYFLYSCSYFNVWYLGTFTWKKLNVIFNCQLAVCLCIYSRSLWKTWPVTRTSWLNIVIIIIIISLGVKKNIIIIIKVYIYKNYPANYNSIVSQFTYYHKKNSQMVEKKSLDNTVNRLSSHNLKCPGNIEHARQHRLLPTISISRDHPPRASMMMLCCFIS